MKNEHVEQVQYKGYTINIDSDNDPMDPREWDNLGVMVCFHGKYKLGDSNAHGLNSSMFNGWKELAEYLQKEKEAAVILPLYLYDHSGISISTGAFSCPWDSGQIGFIYVSKADILKEYSAKRITKKLLEKAERILRGGSGNV